MNFAQDIDDHIYQIHGFTDNGIEIAVPGGANVLKTTLIDGIATLKQSFIIAPSTLIEEWSARQVSDLSQDGIISPLLGLDIEILILGSGDRLIFPESSLLAPFMSRGIGVEVMDSRAACRTYNLLSGEGRKVAAAVII
ncbi:MAG: MTH938/NDUFAF3 family protein [Gammaproteobacteria bacterium]|nr:MTH938/NDUFAF3 family protein [Gammaproteobacteria bacterium]